MSPTETMTTQLVGTWTLDPVHSNVGFEVKYLVGTFRGQFRDRRTGPRRVAEADERGCEGRDARRPPADP